MKLYPFRAELPKLDAITDLSDFFLNVKSKYLKFKERALFHTAEQTAIFLYEITHANGKSYQGIVASTDIKHYLRKDIKGHEATLVEKERKQLKLLEKRKSQVKPILLTYRSVAVIDAWMAQQAQLDAAIEMHLDDTTHKIWRITNTIEIKLITDFFEQYVSTAYIADGHHRSASVARLYQSTPTYDRIMAAFFSFKSLDILDYNRIITHPELERLFPCFQDFFEVKKQLKAAPPKQKFSLSFYYQQQWYRLRWKTQLIEQDDTVLLDTALLNEYIFEGLFSIEDVRSDHTIEYIGSSVGGRGIEKAVHAEGQMERAGFWMYPVSVEDLAALVDTNAVLPPKSTWFEPRMLNGLTVFNLDVS
ncbi:MAG: DUF1015 family protein [Bacteroidota bacterium]